MDDEDPRHQMALCRYQAISAYLALDPPRGQRPARSAREPPPGCEECARDIECDDGDPCTRDGCRLGVCVHLPACVDAGVDTGADAGPPVPPEPSGCACRVTDSGHRSGAPLPFLAVLALFIARRSGRRRAAD